MITRLAAVLDAARPDAERPLREVDLVDVHVDDLGPEPLGLGPELRHQLRAVDAVREARVVLDLARQHQLAAGRGPGEDDRLEVGARRVDRGGQAGRARADDQDLGSRCGPSPPVSPTGPGRAGRRPAHRGRRR